MPLSKKSNLTSNQVLVNRRQSSTICNTSSDGIFLYFLTFLAGYAASGVFLGPKKTRPGFIGFFFRFSLFSSSDGINPGEDSSLNVSPLLGSAIGPSPSPTKKKRKRIKTVCCRSFSDGARVYYLFLGLTRFIGLHVFFLFTQWGTSRY